MRIGREYIDMGKKILILTASPRRFSNSTAMAHWAAAGAKSADADVTLISVQSLDYKVPGCLGCCSCQSAEGFRCALGDGIAHLVESVPQYDVVVFASPVYFFSFPAQVKMVLDRFMCLCKEKSNAIAHVRFALINSAGDNAEESGVSTLQETIRRLASFVGAPAPEFFFQGGLYGDSRELENQPDLTAKLYEFGKKLANA